MKEPIINCDWLQLHVDTSRYREKAYSYDIKLLPVRTKTFAKVAEIWRDNRPLATLQYQPHSPKLPKGCGILKIENYILYSTARFDVIQQLITDLDLTTLGITRIDIAGDCQTVAGMQPQELVQRIIDGRLCTVTHCRQSVIGDVERVTAYGKRDWQYLRYGSRSSRISTYFYNKSLELRQVSDKPYIRGIWAANGFALKKRDTWRLEFSIKGRQMNYISSDTGEVLPQYWRDFIANETMCNIFNALQRQYFNVCIPDHTRRTNYTSAKLWDKQGEPNLLVKYLDATKHCNRADKIFLRKLCNIANELQDPTTINLATQLAERYASIKDLGQWMQAEQLKPQYSDQLI